MSVIMEFVLLGEGLTLPGDLPEGAELAIPDRETNPNEIIEIDMPKGSRLLSAQFNNVGQLALSAFANRNERQTQRSFVVLKKDESPPSTITTRGTNHPTTVTYVAAAQRRPGAPAVHVFEIMPR